MEQKLLMPCKFVLYAVAAAALALLVIADAQVLAGTFDQLRVLVKPGDTISVIDPTGNEIRGKIETLSSSSMALLVAGRRRDLREDEIDTIRQRRPDSLRNGALWGFGIGAGLGTLAGLALMASECHSDCLSGWFVPFAASCKERWVAALGWGWMR